MGNIHHLREVVHSMYRIGIRCVPSANISDATAPPNLFYDPCTQTIQKVSTCAGAFLYGFS
jgi:hypothetical protein